MYFFRGCILTHKDHSSVPNRSGNQTNVQALIRKSKIKVVQWGNLGIFHQVSALLFGTLDYILEYMYPTNEHTKR